MKQKFKDLFSKKNWPHANEIVIQTDEEDLPVQVMARVFIHSWEGLVLIARLTQAGRLEMSLSPCKVEYRGVPFTPDNVETTTGNYDFTRNPDAILKSIQKRIGEGNSINDANNAVIRGKEYIDAIVEGAKRAYEILDLPLKSDKDLYYEQEKGNKSQSYRPRATQYNRLTTQTVRVGTTGQKSWVIFDNLTDEQTKQLVKLWKGMQ